MSFIVAMNILIISTVFLPYSSDVTIFKKKYTFKVLQVVFGQDDDKCIVIIEIDD